MRRDAGFTLIEVVCVLAIIALIEEEAGSPSRTGKKVVTVYLPAIISFWWAASFRYDG